MSRVEGQKFAHLGRPGLRFGSGSLLPRDAREAASLDDVAGDFAFDDAAAL